MALPQYSSFMRLPLRGYPGAGLWKDCRRYTRNLICPFLPTRYHSACVVAAGVVLSCSNRPSTPNAAKLAPV
jgi:hypothetical protein